MSSRCSPATTAAATLGGAHTKHRSKEERNSKGTGTLQVLSCFWHRLHVGTHIGISPEFRPSVMQPMLGGGCRSWQPCPRHCDDHQREPSATRVHGDVCGSQVSYCWATAAHADPEARRLNHCDGRQGGRKRRSSDTARDSNCVCWAGCWNFGSQLRTPKRKEPSDRSRDRWLQSVSPSLRQQSQSLYSPSMCSQDSHGAVGILAFRLRARAARVVSPLPGRSSSRRGSMLT